MVAAPKKLPEFGGVRLREGELEQTHVAGRDHKRHLLAIICVSPILALLSPFLPETLVCLERGHCVQEVVHVVLRPEQVLRLLVDVGVGAVCPASTPRLRAMIQNFSRELLASVR